MKILKKLISFALSGLIISFCLYMTYCWAGWLWWLHHPQALLQRCEGLCSYGGIVWAYVGALLYVCIALWVAVKPPKGVGFFVLAVWWLLLMSVFVSEIVEYGQNPRPYPYSLEQGIYLGRIKTEALLACWSLLGILQTYLKGRKRLGFFLFHSVGSVLIVLLNQELFFPEF